MEAGKLRHRITIQRKAEVADGIGGFTTTWSELTQVWAAIWPVSAKEAIANQGLEGQATHRIRIRYLSGLTSKDRIVFSSRTFHILSVINTDERNIQQDLICLEVV